jgi:hypothetical protein
MLPFLSTADVLFACGVVAGVSALAGIVYALAWHQRPALAAAARADASVLVTQGAAAESRMTASA